MTNLTDLDFAAEAIRIGATATQALALHRIVVLSAAGFAVDCDEAVAGARTHRMAAARRLAICLARDCIQPPPTYVLLGLLLHRDFSSLVKAKHLIDAERAEDPVSDAKIATLEAILREAA